MTKNSSRRVHEEAAASFSEIKDAIETLFSTSDWAKLKIYADIRVRILGMKADGKTGDDLMQTALIDLLEDTRRWNKSKVRFVQFLFGAIKSISSNWAKSYKKEKAHVLETDLQRENEEGEIFNPLENLKGNTPNHVKRLSDRQTLKMIEELFKDDEQAQMLLEASKERYDSSEIRELWSLSQKEYNTIVRRIRRKLITNSIPPDSD
jgi:DNA-directed RNA polymerase specialized sigma24 family protein